MTTKRYALYMATGFLFYLGALTSTLPAPWIATVIEHASTKMLFLRDPVGTAWSGSGQLYLRQHSGDPLDIGRLRWAASPAGILTGKLETDLVLGDATSSMHLVLSPATIAIRGLSLELPGRILA